MQNSALMTARQIKAARALLGWLQEDLASAADLSVATIRKLELGYISPRSCTMAKIRSALEENGLEFLNPDGVRHRVEYITTYTGPDGTIDFFDDILKTAGKRGEEVLIVCKSGTLFDLDERGIEKCMQKMAALKEDKAAVIKCLLTENLASPLTASFCECRLLSKHFVDPAPFYVYGDKYAIFENRGMPKIIVIQSLMIAQSIRQQFYSMWDKAMLYGTPGAMTIGTQSQPLRQKRV